MRKVWYNMLKLSHILSVLNWHLQHQTTDYEKQTIFIQVSTLIKYM